MAAAIWKLASIGVIVVGFLVGSVFYYITSPFAKEEKKKQLEEFTSLFINFIIFIWIGKILIHLDIFIQDPLAILAYPSNSQAFYIAVIFLIANIIYKIKRKNFNYVTWLKAFVPIFFSASFVYEFIQLVFLDESIGLANLGLYAILLLLFLFVQDYYHSEAISFIWMILWGMGEFVLLFWEPFLSIFGYMMSPWFFVCMVILFFVQWLYYLKRKVS